MQLVLPELARILLRLSGVLRADALHVGMRMCVAEVARMMCIGLTLDCGHMVDDGPSLALYPPLQVLQEFHVITLRNFDATGSAVDGRLAVLGNATSQSTLSRRVSVQSTLMLRCPGEKVHFY